MKSLKNPQSTVLLWTQQLYYTCCFIITLTEVLASVGARVTGCMFDDRVCAWWMLGVSGFVSLLYQCLRPAKSIALLFIKICTLTNCECARI